MRNINTNCLLWVFLRVLTVSNNMSRFNTFCLSSDVVGDNDIIIIIVKTEDTIKEPVIDTNQYRYFITH